MSFGFHVKKFIKDMSIRMRDSVPVILYYAKTELTPPKPTEIKEIGQGMKSIISSYRTKAYRDLTVKQAFLNFLVAFEIGGWFWLGEIIGRKNIIGYHIQY